MEVLNPFKKNREKFGRVCQIGMLFVLWIYTLWLLFGFLYSIPSYKQRKMINAPLNLDINNIGKGPLALIPIQSDTKFIPLIRELVLIGKNTRPDQVNHVSSLQLGFKSSSSKREAIDGETLFVSMNQKGQYIFSQQPSEISLMPLLGDKDFKDESIIMQINLGLNKSEKIRIPLPNFLKKSLDEECYVIDFKKGKMWDFDVFLKEWGGSDYQDLASQYRLEINGKVIFLSVGDCLFWNGEEWQKKTELTLGKPLAKLFAVSSDEAKFEIWDEKGYISIFHKFPLQQETKIDLKADEIISSARFRALHEITCQLGKRRVVLKEGDWWVKNDRRWKNLKTIFDLDSFIMHQFLGELFIFEKIENEKGKIIVKGLFFDRMRTSYQRFCWVFNTEKKKFTNTPKKSSLSLNKIKDLVHSNKQNEDT